MVWPGMLRAPRGRWRRCLKTPGTPARPRRPLRSWCRPRQQCHLPFLRNVVRGYSNEHGDPPLIVRRCINRVGRISEPHPRDTRSCAVSIGPLDTRTSRMSVDQLNSDRRAIQAATSTLVDTPSFCLTWARSTRLGKSAANRMQYWPVGPHHLQVTDPTGVGNQRGSGPDAAEATRPQSVSQNRMCRLIESGLTSPFRWLHELPSHRSMRYF